LKNDSAVDDATLRPMLQNMIPTVDQRDVIEYFNSKVAMREKRKTDSYTRDEIYKYRERFLDFVQHFQSFWATCEESPVKFQIDLFLNAIQPPDFRKKLTEGRSMLKTLQQVLKEFDKQASFFLAIQSTSKKKNIIELYSGIKCSYTDQTFREQHLYFWYLWSTSDSNFCFRRKKG
jgi:hypothetical protein